MPKDKPVTIPLKFQCPSCGKNLDCHVDVDPKFRRKPQEGDMSVCFYCAAYLMFKWEKRVMTLISIKLEDVPEQYRAQLQQARELTQSKGFCA